jgi:hypothetical protein
VSATARDAFIFGLLFFSGVSIIRGGNGDPVEDYPGYPIWYERAALVLTNACRLGPQDYRDIYLGDYQILLSENYPPVTPLYMNIDLNRAARAHALDMANNCGLQHSSCDGTGPGDRIRSYYTKGYGWGENIAYYNYRPQSTIRQWLMDADGDGIPAPDNYEADSRWRSGDGHRSNLMGSGYEEIGIGFATGPQGGNQWQEIMPYWVQDFGAGENEYNNHCIPSGSHLFLGNEDDWQAGEFDADSITFMANYYTEVDQAPNRARVNIDGAWYDLTLQMGRPGQGTWYLAFPKGTACREYFYEFEDHAGQVWRYPEQGYLLTYGEGDCETDYTPEPSAFTKDGRGQADLKAAGFIIKRQGTRVEMLLNAREEALSSTYILDVHGKEVRRIEWGRDMAEKRTVVFDLKSDQAQGLYFVVNRFRNGSLTGKRIVICD